jgi:hypothetical protein
MDLGSAGAVKGQQTDRPQSRTKEFGEGGGLAQPPLHKIPAWRGQRRGEFIGRVPIPIEKHNFVAGLVVGIGADNREAILLS